MVNKYALLKLDATSRECAQNAVPLCEEVITLFEFRLYQQACNFMKPLRMPEHFEDRAQVILNVRKEIRPCLNFRKHLNEVQLEIFL